jgi:hypothetical protein
MLAGAVLVPLYVPVKPTVTVPPDAMLALYEALLTVTVSPDRL